MTEHVAATAEDVRQIRAELEKLRARMKPERKRRRSTSWTAPLSPGREPES
jgi:hypothetical protein